MRTARISDLGRGHPRAEFVPKLRVESFHRSDSEGCTIVTIERPSPDQFSTGPLYIYIYIYIYMCALRARGLAPSRVFLLYRTDNRLPTPVWSKISNVLKRFGFRSHNFITQLLSEP